MVVVGMKSPILKGPPTRATPASKPALITNANFTTVPNTSHFWIAYRGGFVQVLAKQSCIHLHIPF